MDEDEKAVIGNGGFKFYFLVTETTVSQTNSIMCGLPGVFSRAGRRLCCGEHALPVLPGVRES